LANHASAYKVVKDFDGVFCIRVVPYDSAWISGAGGTITAAPATSLAPGGDGPTVAPNGLNDPIGDIKQAAVDAWGTWQRGGAAVTIYEAGGDTPVSPAITTAPTQDLDWCQMYSTSAPDHYCKGDGNLASWQKPTAKATIKECCESNHATEYNDCYEASAGIVS